MSSRWAQNSEQYLERIALSNELLVLLEHMAQGKELQKRIHWGRLQTH